MQPGEVARPRPEFFQNVTLEIVGPEERIAEIRAEFLTGFLLQDVEKLDARYRIARHHHGLERHGFEARLPFLLNGCERLKRFWWCTQQTQQEHARGFAGHITACCGFDHFRPGRRGGCRLGGSSATACWCATLRRHSNRQRQRGTQDHHLSERAHQRKPRSTARQVQVGLNGARRETRGPA